MALTKVLYNGVEMTQSQYARLCRAKKTEENYYTEDEIASRCEYWCKKYNMPYKLNRDNWFEGQIIISEMLGCDWMDFYNKAIDTESLFKAYSIEHGTLQENRA
jgi:hypothetical protein